MNNSEQKYDDNYIDILVSSLHDKISDIKSLLLESREELKDVKEKQSTFRSNQDFFRGVLYTSTAVSTFIILPLLIWALNKIVNTDLAVQAISSKVTEINNKIDERTIEIK